MDRILRLTVPTAIIIAAFLLRPIPTEPISVSVEFPQLDIPAPVVTITHEPAIINVDIQTPTGDPGKDVTVVVEPAPIPPAEVVYRDRTVEVERIVEVRACLDYANLPYFDLANALSVAFPGAQWSLNGSYWNGLVWLDESPQPTFQQVLGGWLTHLERDC